MITKFGRRFIAQYLAGQTSFPAQDLAVGIDSTPTNVNGNDTRLGFEFYRIPITLGTIDIQTDQNGNSTYAVVYKTTLPQDVAGKIKEIGLYPSSRLSVNNYDSKFISDFENNLLWTDSNGNNPELVTSPSARIGATLAKCNVVSSQTREFITKINSLDMSGYSANDTLTFALNQSDINLNSIKIKFYSSDTSYSYINFTSLSGTGEKILSANLSQIQTFGSPDVSSINKVGVEVVAKNTGDTVVYFDGIRINDEDTFDPRFGLIARSVLSETLDKKAGRPADIEFRLGINF
jgi:hypothetical protein